MSTKTFGRHIANQKKKNVNIVKPGYVQCTCTDRVGIVKLRY